MLKMNFPTYVGRIYYSVNDIEWSASKKESRRGKGEAMADFLSLGSKITEMVTIVMKSEDDCFLAGKQ